MVWAVPVSLAATKGIARTFFLIIMAQPKLYLIRKKVPFIAFYSSKYWDVSLPQVRILIQGFLVWLGGFPHSEISGSKVIWHLTETYRSHITSFIASWNQGIHHTPFVPVRNAVHRSGGVQRSLVRSLARSCKNKFLRDSRSFRTKDAFIHHLIDNFVLLHKRCTPLYICWVRPEIQTPDYLFCCLPGTKRPERLQNQTQFLTRQTIPVL